VKLVEKPNGILVWNKRKLPIGGVSHCRPPFSDEVRTNVLYRALLIHQLPSELSSSFFNSSNNARQTGG
jgi:hypothetical protein